MQTIEVVKTIPIEVIKDVGVEQQQYVIIDKPTD